MPLTPVENDFWDVATPVEARAKLVEALNYELLGPSEPEEELYESPVTRYVTGQLAPYGTGVLPSERDDSLAPDGGDEDQGMPEGAAPMSQAITPSSIGISFLIADSVDRVRVQASWGDYERIRAADEDD